jgi:hypothetical protein
MKAKKQPRPKPAPDWLPAARKNGEGVRQTFLRIIAREMGCTIDEAGQIVETGVTGLTGSVIKYRAC